MTVKECKKRLVQLGPEMDDYEIVAFVDEKVHKLHFFESQTVNFGENDLTHSTQYFDTNTNSIQMVGHDVYYHEFLQFIKNNPQLKPCVVLM